MKKFFPLLLCLNFSIAFSQPSLDNTSFPIAGISYNRFIAVGGSIGNAGPNQFYDFSNSFIWMNDTIRYLNPATTPFATFHPGATVATMQTGEATQIMYYSSDTNAFWLSGSTLMGDFGMGFTVTHANHPLPYTDTLISNEYTYGHTETEISGMRFVNIYPGIDFQTISGKYIVCDGYGTLYAPLDTFTNVLRVKYIEFKYDTAFSNNVPIDAKSDTLYYYKYFMPGIRNPVVTAYTNDLDQLEWLEMLVMPDVLNGCTDSLAQNFNPLANQNNGTCIYCNQITYNISPDTSVCAGDSLELNASGATDFLWSTGDTVSAINVNPDSTQTYSVYLNYQSYCWQIATSTISVYEDAQAAFWPDVTNPDDGDTILFVNTSANAINFFWDFGDSATSTEKSPRHLFTSSGTKNIMLIAYNSCSSDTVFMTIIFSGVEDLKVSDFNFQIFPNPNNGIFNVQWMIPDGNISAINQPSTFEIYNVFGQIIYQQNIFSRHGTLEIKLGTEVPQGIYFVRLKAGYRFYQQRFVKM